MEDVITKIHPVDRFVGERLRHLRKKHNLSQTALGEMVGCSFQQIQKYERGFNRIPASKLYEFAEVLNAPITYFYEGINIDDKSLDIAASEDRIKFKRTAPLNVLLVENDPADVLRARKAIENCKTETVIHVEHDGAKAKQFLRSKSKKPFVQPDIIITALKLPKIDGISLLKDIKKDKDLKDIPVIVLTNSVDVADMLKSYRWQAAGFIGKAVDEDQFAKNMESAISYWGQAVALPSM